MHWSTLHPKLLCNSGIPVPNLSPALKPLWHQLQTVGTGQPHPQALMRYRDWRRLGTERDGEFSRRARRVTPHAEDDWERGWVRALVWPSGLKPCGGRVFQPQSQVLEFNSSVTKPIGLLLSVGIFSFVRFLMLCAWPRLPFALWSLAKEDSSRLNFWRLSFSQLLRL